MRQDIRIKTSFFAIYLLCLTNLSPHLQASITQRCEFFGVFSFKSSIQPDISEEQIRPTRLIFTGVGNRDVYNPAIVPMDGKSMIIAARVESRKSEHSQVMFFEPKGETWRPIRKAPVFDLQDPFMTRIGGEIIFGGVEIHDLGHNKIEYKTIFYRGKTIYELDKFAEGPSGMKDIRLLDLHNDKILVFTRPQGGTAGPGKVGYLVINSLTELTPKKINKAPSLEYLFEEGEWGGTNEPHLLPGGLVGVLGHVAYFDSSGIRHYNSMVFFFEPETGAYTKPRIILRREELPQGEYKRNELRHIIFSGALIQHGGKKADLFMGVNDAETWHITVPNPLLLTGNEEWIRND